MLLGPLLKIELNVFVTALKINMCNECQLFLSKSETNLNSFRSVFEKKNTARTITNKRKLTF